jgi:hypothetical protein
MSSVFRRLLPLFVAKFLLNVVFWYSIEKLFMTSIGFDMALIGVMAAYFRIIYQLNLQNLRENKKK